MPSRRTVPARAAATTALALLLGALTTLLALSPSPAAAHPVRTGVHRATDPAASDPLSVSIDSLTPSTLRTDAEHGTIRVSGTVTNKDTETWQALNVYAVVGTSPLTSESELADASVSDPAGPVGERITTFGDFATLPDLAPGASATFEIAIPRADLHGSFRPPITAPGVYWFGVQVLGNTGDEARDEYADGRARTFLPLVDRPAHVHPEKAALVVPLRQRVLRQPDGRIAGVERWARQLSAGGRLSALVDFATGRQLSWLIDPAVIDAVEQLAAGNPPRDLGPTDGSGGSDNGSGSGDGSGDEDGGTTPPPATDGPTSVTTPAALAKHVASDDATDPTMATVPAKAWLARLLPALRQSPAVYALPYGDLDLSAAARHDPALYAVARERGAAVLSALDISATPLDSSATGYVQPGALRLGESTTPLLLSDRAITGTAPPAATMSGRTIYATSALVAAGGPGPGQPLGLVPVRQELLAQAALRLATHRPILAVLPPQWVPGADDDGFFLGLDQPWLDLTTVSGAVGSRPARELDDDRLHYPDTELTAELPAPVFKAVGALRTVGERLQSVLPHNDTVGTAVLDDALTSASYTARGATGAAGTAADRSRAAIQAQLRSITVDAPPSVTLSSNQGKFNAVVVNGLDQPIRITMRAVSDRRLTIGSPGTLDIPAHGHASVLLVAHARANGIHNVTLQLTNADGKPLGSHITFPIRTAQVSRIIWLFIGGGVGLLFAAIVARLVRRLRRRDGGDAGAETGGDAGGDAGSDIGGSAGATPTEAP